MDTIGEFVVVVVAVVDVTAVDVDVVDVFEAEEEVDAEEVGVERTRDALGETAPFLRDAEGDAGEPFGPDVPVISSKQSGQTLTRLLMSHLTTGARSLEQSPQYRWPQLRQWWRRR